MVKTDRFTFKLDAEDRRLLGLLAEEVRRTQSDTLRWLIRMASSHLAEPGDYMAGDADRPEDWAVGALSSAGGEQ